MGNGCRLTFDHLEGTPTVARLRFDQTLISALQQGVAA
jgi:hypothetical protein